MKNWRIFIFIGIAVLLNSCIIKSIQPFYTAESLSYNAQLLGNWTDNKKGQWKVESLKSKFEEDRKEGVELSEYEIKTYNKYKDGYYIEYIKDNKIVGFIAMPFKIDEQYFLDFIPLEYEAEDLNKLAAQHLVNAHSVAKLDIDKGTNVSFYWLDEDNVKDLINAEKLRIKHETIGIQEDILLTASSSELYAFLKKYQKADIENKWKKSESLQLTKNNAKP